MKNNMRLLLGACLVILLAMAIGRAAKVQQLAGMGDMRGRVVGARLVKEGKLPYYYHWYPGDPMYLLHGALFDSSRVQGRQVSALTASPAVLEAMIPIAGLQQYQIDWGAFVLFHIFFIISILLALRYAPRGQWLTVLLLTIPIAFTDGWLYHFMLVQYYMLFGFMLLLISLFFLRKKEILAGIVFALLILFRFNTIVFILPFLLAGLKYRKFILSTATIVAAYVLLVWLSPFQKSLWREYFEALKDNQVVHMDETLGTAIQPKDHRVSMLTVLPRPFEGMDYHRVDSLGKQEPATIYQESSSFKQAFKAVWRRYPPAWLLSGLLLAVVGALSIWLLRSQRQSNNEVPEYKYVLTGLLFYFLSSFFSTITTATYHFPQWWAVAVILAIYAHRVPRASLILFVLGVAISFYVLPGFRGKHLLSEVLLLSSCILAIIAPPRPEEPVPKRAVPATG